MTDWYTPIYQESLIIRAVKGGFLRENLPWIIKKLEREHPESYREWLSHVQTTLSELEYVGVVEREDDRHAYLRLRYKSGVEVPSWMNLSQNRQT